MEYGDFKRAFFAGDLIWIEGVSEDRDPTLMNALERLRVRPSCVEFVDSKEFFASESAGPKEGFEVLAVRLNSNPDPAQFEVFGAILERTITLQKENGFRVVLLSSDFDRGWIRFLERFRPMRFVLPLIPVDRVMDRTVHRLIEMASAHAEVQVSRISEKAAFFLEESARVKVDGELVALVVLGLKRSDGQVLRFRDLLPNFHCHFEGGKDGETV